MTDEKHEIMFILRDNVAMSVLYDMIARYQADMSIAMDQKDGLLLFVNLDPQELDVFNQCYEWATSYACDMDQDKPEGSYI